MNQSFKFAALALLLAGVAGAALADEPKKDGQWRGAAGIALSASNGNTKSSSYLVNADLARLTADDKITLGAYLNEGRSKSNGVTTTTASKFGVAGRYDYNLTEKVFGFGSLALDHDGVIDLSWRALVGGGLGYHVIRDDRNTFDVFGGLSYNSSNYSVEQTIGSKTGKQFNSFGLLLGEESSHKLTDTVSVKQRLEYYPGLTGEKAQLVKFSAGLSAAMSNSMALTVGLLDTYSSKVGQGQTKNDLTMFTGVTVKLNQ
jgi:putative salt-induced outer membrane protein